jgi:hypothetical protein
MSLSGVDAYELSLLSKEVRVADEVADTIESVAGGWHTRGGDGNYFLGAVGARLGGWQGQCSRGQRLADDGILVRVWLCLCVVWA